MGFYHQCKERGYATPVDMLMNIGVLTKAKYEDWRFGRIPFLEAACTVNLHRLSFAMKQMRSYARKAGLKPSYCYYKRWGVKKKPGQKRPVLRSASANMAILMWRNSTPRIMWTAKELRKSNRLLLLRMARKEAAMKPKCRIMSLKTDPTICGKK